MLLNQSYQTILNQVASGQFSIVNETLASALADETVILDLVDNILQNVQVPLSVISASLIEQLFNISAAMNALSSAINYDYQLIAVTPLIQDCFQGFLSAESTILNSLNSFALYMNETNADAGPSYLP